MGNCQAADAAMVIIQHPSGRVERVYWPISASEVMKSNPGHYIGLVTICRQPVAESGGSPKTGSNHICFTRIKLLRAKDTLMLGHVYRLVTPQDVMKGLWAKKYAKMKKQLDPERHHLGVGEDQRPAIFRDAEQERHGKKAKQSARPSRQWRPGLQSISEIGSGCNTPSKQP